jgi:hypothetical protein
VLSVIVCLICLSSAEEYPSHTVEACQGSDFFHCSGAGLRIPDLLVEEEVVEVEEVGEIDLVKPVFGAIDS